jgi:hypothetical protein
MAVYTIQPTFSGGEFSPSLYSRVDVQKYSTGLKKLKNFIVHPHGGTSNRPGMEFLQKAKYPNKKTRLIPFEFSLSQAYVLEFGEEYVRFRRDGGLILTPLSAIFEVATPYQEEDLADIKFTQSADVLFLFHPNYPIKRLTRYSDNEWIFDDFPFINGPFMPEKKTSTISFVSPGMGGFPVSTGLLLKGFACPITTVENFFQTGHLGSLIKINQFIQSGSITNTITGNVYVPSTRLIVKGTWRLATRGTWAGQLAVLRSVPGSYVGWEILKTFTHNSTDFNIDAFGSEDEICHMAIGMDLWGGGTCYADLSCDSFNTEGVVKVTSVTNVNTANIEVISPVLAYNAINSWQEGSWSTQRGFPICGGFYQDRLVAAATPSELQTVWTSKTGNYFDFGTTSPLEDTDSVSVNLPSRKMNAIKNLIPLSEILAFTSASECGVGETGGVFSPTTVKTKTYGYRGSSGTDPVIVGNRVIMVQSMGSVVRDFGYDFQADGFTGNDLSIFSNHLFKNYEIVEMAYQQEPDSLVWAVRSDGKLLSMTYMKEQDVVAWSWHETQGSVESICTIPGDGQNDLYLVVNREGERFVEKLSKRITGTDATYSTFLDSFLTYSGSLTTTITGLDHLNGRTVKALSDGRVVNNLTVTAGAITLPVAANVVHVGLSYESDFQTLDVQVPMADGSGYGRLVKISEVSFNFLNSRGGYIGPDENNLDEIIDLSPLYLTDPKELFTGDFKQMITSGYEPGGSVFFRQVDPLPVTILAVQPKTTIGG